MSLALRVLAALAVSATTLVAVPGVVERAAAQVVCPSGSVLGTSAWGSGGTMVWANNAAHSVSGASETYPNIAGGVDLVLSYTDPDNVNEDNDNPYLNFVSGDSWDGPVYTRTNGVYGANYFTVVMNSLTSAQTVDWQFSFSKPVFLPDFSVGDIDWAGYGYSFGGGGTPHESFQDEIIFTGQRGGTAIPTTAVAGSGILNLGNGHVVAGPYTPGVNGNVGPTNASGTARMVPDGPVTSFSMQYSNGPDDATADAADGSPPAPIPPNSPGVSNNHAVAVNNFAVCAGILQLGDRVWADVDGDGVQDTNEPGVAGVVVSIADVDGNVVETQVTDANGNYLFTEYPAYDWVISIATPAGYTPTHDRDSGDLTSTTVNLTANVADIDFGLQPDPGTITGTVIADRNDNGALDAASFDSPLPGVTITLAGVDLAGNTVSATTTTSADGTYTFSGIPAGTYTVTETQPAAGFADGIDTPGTNASANGNDEHAVTLGLFDSSVGNDFAEVPTSSLAGTVFQDLDNDGNVDAGETGIGGVTITVSGIDTFGTPITITTTTAADGTYLVSRLIAGDYTVTETQPTGFVDGLDSAGSSGGTVGNDVITSIPLGFDVAATGYDFGELIVSSISGTVTDDAGGGIGGATLTLTGTDDRGASVSLTTTTAADGTYTFDDLRPGTYTITETQPLGYGDGPDSVGTIGGTIVGDNSVNDVISGITLGAAEAGVDYDFSEQRGSIAGTVTDDGGNGIAGVTITLTGNDVFGNPVSATTTTAADGTFIFDDLVGGTYTITESQPAGYGDGPESAGTAGGDTSTNDQIGAITLPDGNDATGYDFEETTGSLSGRVFVDPENDGSFGTTGVGEPGVTITLTGTDIGGNPVNATTTTAANGTYRFDGLIAGIYTLAEAQPAALVDGIDTVGSEGAGAVSDDTFGAITLGAGVNGTGYDFAELSPAGISGTVTNSMGDPISGVTITLTGTDDFGSAVSSTTATAADGSYTFYDLAPGTYTVSETQPAGYGDGPDSVGTVGGTTNGTLANDRISDIVLGPDDVGIDYDFTETEAAIAGAVRDDAGNGIGGVTISLTGTDDLGNPVTATTTTAADGTYSFETLRPGTYTVTETQPTGYGDGGETAGTVNGSTVGNDSVDDVISSITLGAGESAIDYDFDETTASLSGTVFDDLDGDGTRGALELGIGGVTIDLSGTDDLGNPVTASTTTAADGTYTFATLVSGTYTVTETQPTGYLDGADSVGSAGGTVTDDEVSSIVLAAGSTATGYDFGEVQPGSIAGTVYLDSDESGDQNGPEPGIGGVSIALSGTDDLGNPVSTTATTAADGTYTFSGLRPGTYTVTETQPSAYLDGQEQAGSAGGNTSVDDVISAISIDSGEDATGYDFGELTAASISGTVTDDGGNGIGGTTITLTGTDDLGNPVLASTTTGADGTYALTGLRPGSYTVTETQPTGYGDGGETAGTAGGTVTDDQISAISLAAGEDATGYDFDETRGSISGAVFHDLDANGTRNGAEPGIAGVAVRLIGIDVYGTPVVRATTTAADGTYTFTGVIGGTYEVIESQPTVYLDGQEQAGTAGGDDTTTNDRISSITLPGGDNATGYTFGEVQFASIAGTVYDDLDNSGTQNATEPGIGGVTVDLTGTDDLGNPVSASATTAADGSYLFDALRPGTYTVTETQPTGYLDGADSAGTAGGTVTNDQVSAIVLGSAEDATGYDFGELDAASIAGNVADDGGNGIDNTTIALSGTDDLGNPVSATTTTAADGTYTFGTLRPGTYTVTETQPTGYGDGGETAGTAGGTVTDDQIAAITLEPGEDATGYDFDETRSSLTGTVYLDSDESGSQNGTEPGIGGVTIDLTGTDDLGNAVSASSTTAADGTYIFDDLISGTYTVAETQPGAYLDGQEETGSAGGDLSINDSISSIVLPGGVDASGYDFGELLAASIAGTVTDDGGNGIANVTLTLTGTDDLGNPVTATTTTAADGTYSFNGLRPGTYTVTETQPTGYGDGGETAGTAGGTVTDDTISAIILRSAEDATGYDFDETRGSITGLVFHDIDNDGIQTGAEPGIGLVTVTLSGTDDLGNPVSASTTTAPDGSYTFTGVIGGTYEVVESQPGAYLDGIDTAGTAGGDTSTNDRISSINLPGGADATGYVFAEITASSLAGTVYNDHDNSGDQNEVEPGIGGVSIDLSGTDDLGNSVSASTTTAADGTYAFTGLRPGTYAISETQPGAYLDGTDSAGTAGGDTSVDDLISAIGLPPGTDATGYDFGELDAASIAGTVTDDGGNGIVNTTITLTGTDDLGNPVSATTTTAADGTYAFAGLRPGTYTVTETQPTGYGDGSETAGTAGGTVTDDVVSSITLDPDENAAGYDFDETRGSITGTVFHDLDANGTHSGAEPGISGISVDLTGTDDLGNPVTASTTTAADGAYTFDDLISGTYTLTETQPVGYLDGQDQAGTAGGDTSTNDTISSIALPGGDDATGYDFGEVRAASVGGTVTDDTGNGIENVTLTVAGTDDLGNPVSATTTTAADGTYAFNGLRPGTYTITETQPAGYLDGGETPGTAGGTVTDDQISSITLGSGTNAVGYDFDELRPSSISGTVTDDGGNGIANTTITLTGTDDFGNPTTATTTTAAAAGTYTFDDLRPGTYTVTETQPTGYGDGGETAGTAGGTVTDDVVSSISIVPGEDATGYDFDETRGSLTGTVYNDLDNDGTQGALENGIGLVTVTLTGTDDLGNPVSASTTTAANGSYSFDDLLSGSYTITETQPRAFLDGMETAGTAGGDTTTNDTISSINLPGGNDATGYDFGELDAASIAGTVTDDGGNGIVNTTITLTGTDDLGNPVSAATTTAADGTYIFNGLRPGTYTVTETQPIGYGDGGETAGSAGGVVSDESIAGIPLDPGTSATGYDFDETRGSITGTVFHDLDADGTLNGTEPGISGISVDLTGTDDLGNPVSAGTTTAADGTYTFDDLISGTYTLTEIQPVGYLDGADTAGTAGGDTTTNDTISSIALPGGDDATGYDFGEVRAASIAGIVYIDSDNSGAQNGAEAGIDAVTITLTGTDDLGNPVSASTATAADGTYTFTSLRPGTYTVTETQPAGLSDGIDRVGSAGGTLSNDSVSDIALGSDEDATGYDFGELEGASVGGTVTDDSGNGIANTTITLTGTDDLGNLVSASTTTAADGTYTFNGLRPGTYTLTETQPTGYGDGGETAGTAGGVVSDDSIAAITLGSGQIATGYDFDEATGSLAGSVYLDADGNGVRNGADTGIGGVSVELSGTDDLGNPVTATASTAADGTYSFDDLLSGTYTLTEPSQPAGFVDGLEVAGTSGGTAGNTPATNDTITSISLGPGDDATGYLFGEWNAAAVGGTVTDELGRPIPGVTLTLSGTDDDGDPVNQTVTTGPGGSYTFTGLEPGTYTITETQPAAYGDGTETAGSLGGDTTVDDRIASIPVGPGDVGTGYDFVETLGAITGAVYDDLDGDGALDATEPGIGGVTLDLAGTDANGNPVSATVLTAADGTYAFDGLVGGTYSVSELQPAGYLDGGETVGSSGGSAAINDVISGIVTSGGMDATGYDFGEIDAASVSGSVVDDGGNPITGATITLTGTDDLGDAVNLTELTDANGVYSFDGLRPGTYTVTETQPTGYGDGGESAGPAGGTVTDDQITDIVLGPDTDATDNDFDEIRSSLRGLVFDDLDSDGSRTFGEPGIDGTTLTLTGTDVLGNPVNLTTISAGGGLFGFDGLLSGTYTLTETQPIGYVDGIDTVGTAGGDGTTQNDQVSGIPIGAGTSDSGYLFGEVAPVSIAGAVFLDADNDGVHVGAETGVDNVTVTLSGIDDRGQTVTLTTQTIADGTYIFSGLRPGTYAVTETQPAGYLDGIDIVGTVGGSSRGTLQPDQIASISVASGETGVGYDFGELEPASLSGFVADDQGNPIAAVDVSLAGTDDLGNPVAASTTTAADGTYTFSGLRPGTYTVNETQPSGYGDGGETAGSLGGTVTDDQISEIPLTPGAIGTGYDFDDTTGSISGAVFVDNDGDTVLTAADTDLAGVEITLSGTDVNGSPVSALTTTAADGSFGFTGLLAGTYAVDETQPSGYLDGVDTAGMGGGSADNSAGGDSISGINLSAGSAATDNLFSEVEAAELSGAVVDDAGQGIAGVTVTLTGVDLFGQTINTTTSTDGAGDYQFVGLAPGTYTITEIQPTGYGDGGETVGTIAGTSVGTAADDEISAITLGSGDRGIGYDFDETRQSISGTVFVDTDNDGSIDTGEAPIPGVTITLTGTDDLGASVSTTTLTAADGTYWFDGLLTGTYSITETQPSGRLDGIDSVGTAGGTLGNDTITDIALTGGANPTGYDFGELHPASLSGSVTDDAGTGIGGVTLTLTGTDDLGNPVNVTTSTGGGGDYSFDGLRPGVYTVTESQPTGYGDGGETAGTGGGTVTDDQVSTITLGSGQNATGYDFDDTTGSLSGSTLFVTGAGSSPISGVTVELGGTDATGAAVSLSTTTDSSGDYSFTGLLAGTYSIAETQPAAFNDGPDQIGTAGGDNSVNDVISSIPLGAGADESGYDFTETGTVITGQVWLDLTGDGAADPADGVDLGDILIELLDSSGVTVATTTTAPDGSYVIGGIVAGTYTVRQTQPSAWASITPNDVVATVPVSGLAGVDFGEQAGSIRGSVFGDHDADGIDDQTTPQAGVTVALTDSTGTVTSTVTDSAGDYAFTGLAAGDYTVTISGPADTTFTARDVGSDDTIDSDVEPATGAVAVALAAGESVTDLDGGLLPLIPDLAIDITTSVTDARVGDEIPFVVTVTNSGNTPISGGVTVTVPIPSGTTYVSAVGDGWTVTVDDGVVTATRPTAPVTGEAAPPLTLTVEPTAEGTITTTGTVISSAGVVETTTVNNVSSVPVRVRARSTTSIPSLAYTGTSLLLLLLIAGGLLLSGRTLTAVGARARRDDD